MNLEIQRSAPPEGSKYTIDGLKGTIFTACRDGKIDLVKGFIESGKYSINSTDADDATPLHHAARNSQIHVCEYLLEIGSNIDAIDSFGCTPLHLAGGWGNTDTVQFLLNKNANNLVENKHNCTPALFAHAMGRPRAEKLLSDWVPAGGVLLSRTKAHEIQNPMQTTMDMQPPDEDSELDAQIRALKVKENQLQDPNHPSLVRHLISIFELSFESSDFTTAERHLQRAVRIVEELTGKKSTQVASLIQKLAKFYLRSGQHSSAYTCCIRCLSIVQGSFKPTSIEVANCLRSIALVCRASERWMESTKYFRQELECHEKEERFVLMADTLDHLSYNYREMDKLIDAFKVSQQALSLMEGKTSFNLEDPVTLLVKARRMEAIGECLFLQNKGKQSEKWFKSALAIMKKNSKHTAQTEIWRVERNLGSCGLPLKTVLLASPHERQKQKSETEQKIDEMRHNEAMHRRMFETK
eukprot:TRINITY_DN310001_c0_g1_i1.p1 TRINITY_DN310001_c0_g1~~TRINITY_DN310001_c0_g1_i1.p1  ORF type:complete len:469 (-),score=91.58 TRINITY_DN310001_c0_g1_i1:651-2057(-)